MCACVCVCSLHRQLWRSSCTRRSVEGLERRLLHVPLRQRHHRPRGVQLLQHGGTCVPSSRGGDHQPGRRHQLLPAQSLRWVTDSALLYSRQQTLLFKSHQAHLTSKCEWNDNEMMWFMTLQCVTRPCVTSSLLSVNTGRSWFHTTDRTPAVRTTCVVSFCLINTLSDDFT